MTNLQDLPLKGKRVLIRVDFNVPQNKDGTIADDTRIRESLPTIQYVLKQGGIPIVMSHLGRPKGKKDPQYTLAPCAKSLSTLLGIPVLFAPDCIGKQTQKMAEELKPGEVLLLENLRFYPAEEDPKSDPAFAKQLSQLADFYIDDAFGAAHRAHSSIVPITTYFPKKAAAGLLMQKEISALKPLLTHPKRPFYALIGGAKISTKIGCLKSLLKKVNALFIGGGMAYTLFKAQGLSIGDSIHEDDQLDNAQDLLSACMEEEIPLFLPSDLVIADSFTDKAKHKVISTEKGIPAGWQGMDIGPETIALWQTALSMGSTIFWNGPVGVFEFPTFAKGTEAIAKTLASLKATTIVGGGDSVAAINQLHLKDKFSHISTGGGACLELLEFGHLPGIDALLK
jgi:phosphoglycerate kinase